MNSYPTIKNPVHEVTQFLHDRIVATENQQVAVRQRVREAETKKLRGEYYSCTDLEQDREHLLSLEAYVRSAEYLIKRLNEPTPRAVPASFA